MLTRTEGQYKIVRGNAQKVKRYNPSKRPQRNTIKGVFETIVPDSQYLTLNEGEKVCQAYVKKKHKN